MKKDFLGIDLGSNNTTIYSSLSDSILYSEPTCIAIDKFSKEVKEYGFLADKISGKAPYNYDIIFPVKNGVIEDDDACYLYLSSVLRGLKLYNRNKTQVFVFVCPSNTSVVNRKVIFNLGKKLGAKEVYIEAQSKIAALGAGKNVYSPTATFICHIGSGITDIACISMGEIVACSSTNIASDSFNEAIRRYMLQKQHLSVGMKSAEYLKMRIGSVSPIANNRLVEIKGRDTITSLPSSHVVSSSEIKGCLEPLLDIIALKITDVITSLPSELVADLSKKGLIVSGGGSLLDGLKQYLEVKLSMPVRVVDKPLETISDGLAVYAKKN